MTDQPTPLGPAGAPQADIYDATSPPGIEQLPAVTTSMTPEQFKGWLNADGTLFMVILPGQRTFIIKVPTAHHEFFVAMMQQVRFALGPEVQAVRMNMVTGDPAAADGTANEAPDWAKPAPPQRHDVVPDPTTDTSRWAASAEAPTCPGGNKPPKAGTITGRDVTGSGIVRYAGRGDCGTCGINYKLTNHAMVRRHAGDSE